jgi:hypothetical protein
MNPYYATGFVSTLIFWIWPVFLYRSLDAHWLTVGCFFALIFLGFGRAASEIHIRYIAPKHPPRGHPFNIGALCAAIVLLALLTRVAYGIYLGG